eukprot:826770-Pelagomonas_calceolata.AAC.12
MVTGTALPLCSSARELLFENSHTAMSLSFVWLGSTVYLVGPHFACWKQAGSMCLPAKDSRRVPLSSSNDLLASSEGPRAQSVNCKGVQSLKMGCREEGEATQLVLLKPP